MPTPSRKRQLAQSSGTTSPRKTSAKLRQSTGPQPIQDLFSDFALEDKGGYITQEFQDFGYRLAISLNDLEHKSLYMRMAKTIPRSVLEQALSFVSDSNAKSKAKLFMWKVKELRKKV
jgi:hypothetical protein